MTGIVPLAILLWVGAELCQYLWDHTALGKWMRFRRNLRRMKRRFKQ